MIRLFSVPGSQEYLRYVLVEDLSRYLLGKPQPTWAPFSFAERARRG